MHTGSAVLDLDQHYDHLQGHRPEWGTDSDTRAIGDRESEGELGQATATPSPGSTTARQDRPALSPAHMHCSRSATASSEEALESVDRDGRGIKSTTRSIGQSGSSAPSYAERNANPDNILLMANMQAMHGLLTPSETTEELSTTPAPASPVSALRTPLSAAAGAARSVLSGALGFRSIFPSSNASLSRVSS